MLTRSYRSADSPFEQAAAARAERSLSRGPQYATLEIGQTVRFTFPEPPTVNAMIKMATGRTTKGPKGQKLREAVPVYWVQQKRYKALAIAQLDAQGWRRPEIAWRKIVIVRAEFHVNNLRDRLELYASLKWPIDVLVDQDYLINDDPKHLDIEEQPTQIVNRAQRLVHVWIRRDA